MSRRNQQNRRRSYGRRQHEVRERRLDERPADGVLTDAETDFDADWQPTDTHEEHNAFGESYGAFSQ